MGGIWVLNDLTDGGEKRRKSRRGNTMARKRFRNEEPRVLNYPFPPKFCRAGVVRANTGLISSPMSGSDEDLENINKRISKSQKE